jgi:predicted alternative tryptophan synthase beta-subunit
MPHEFVILLNGKLKIYTDYNKIPKKFDNVIKFLPEIPKPPHTPEQHEELDSWNDKLKELIKRETNGIKS